MEERRRKAVPFNPAWRAADTLWKASTWKGRTGWGALERESKDNPDIRERIVRL